MGIIHQAAKLKGGLFSLVKRQDSMIKLANVHANINASNTVSAPPPFLWG